MYLYCARYAENLTQTSSHSEGKNMVALSRGCTLTHAGTVINTHSYSETHTVT